MLPPEPLQQQQQQLQPPPPAPQNHVVTTIENLPAEGSGGSGSLSASSRAGVRQRIRKVLNREMLISVALGQVLSLLICGIGLTSKYLSEDFHANTPVFQSFLNYILLFLVYTTTLAVRQGEENLLAILRRRWWKYMILGLIDLEANYLVVKAYQYTTLTSVQLLDCFVIPVVILLSWFFLLIRYKAVHFIGIVVCILGMGCMVGADVLVGRHQGAGENKLVGDLLVLGGATLYGISNVWEEYIIRTLSRVEFLGMIGLFGAFFSGIQLAIMEHKELLKVPWDWQIGLLYVGFTACMFGLYSFMPVVIKKTSATSVNLSLLTADLYSLFCGLFLFHYKFSGLYLLSFFTILIGLVIYSSTSTYIAQDPRVYKQFRNPSGPVVDLPATAQVEPSVTYTSLGQETEEEPHVRVA
ncbi:solute carrier family 35 member F1 isoform 1-T1 [Glossophaga mutica]